MFDNMIKSYLDNVLSKKDGISELEVRFGTKDIIPITKDNYDNVIKKLLSSGFEISKHDYYILKIQSEYVDSNTGITKLSNIRTEIEGLSDIQKYCKNNRIDGLQYRMIQKGPASNEKGIIKPLNFDDFNFRISYQKEKEVPITSSLSHTIKDSWTDNKKIFRYIHRTSFTSNDYPVCIDISVVKESHRINGKMVPEYTFQSANVIESFPKYEIEIEIINNLVGPGQKLNNYVSVAFMLRNIIKIVLAGLQGTNYPISYDEIFDIQKDYYYMLFPDEYKKDLEKKREERESSKEFKKSIQKGGAIEYDNFKLLPKHFIGPSSYTLQVHNITPINDDTNIPNIRRDYTVTEKADGIRKMLYISQRNGRIYLIDMAMNIQFTGAFTTDEKLYNTLIDGEHILHDKNGEFINLFAAFDIYYLEKRDIRKWRFIRPRLSSIAEAAESIGLSSTSRAVENAEIILETQAAESHIGGAGATPSIKESKKSSKKETKSQGIGSYTPDEQNRLQALNDVIQNLKPKSVIEGDESPIKIIAKSFKTVTDYQSIFNCCDTILRNINQGYYQYKTDGLIFTPANTGVGSNMVGVAGPLMKITWDMSFKWKPMESNTIDFLITTKKDINSKDYIGNKFQDGINTMSELEFVQYKTLILRVGYDEKKHGYLNPCLAIIEDKIPFAGDIDENESYRPIPFYPSNPYDPEANICNVIINPDQYGVLQMFTEEKEIFGDETIVEFRYDITRPPHWRWIPLRVRYDKTAEYRNGLKNYGNAYHVANNNWYSIHNPVTEKMISLGENIPDEIADDNIYYNRISNNTFTRGLRDFHNLYVKKLLIVNTCIKGNTLIDLAVGKAGDFPKWIYAKLSFVFGIDVSKDNIENRIDGACARFLNYRKKFKTMPYALFVNGDSSVNIRSGDAMYTEKGKEITKAIFGEGAKDESVLGKGVYRQYGKAVNGFNVSSCQFAIHYFFQNSQTLNQFLTNVSQCTAINGYFIGTCYDGTTIFNILRSLKTGENMSIHKEGNKIWEITKNYDRIEFNDDISSLGYAIDVYQESINKTFREYLVNFNYLTQLMENYGFVLLKQDEARELNLPNSSGMFNELYSFMEQEVQRNKQKSAEYGYALNMAPYEKQISFYNRYFVFKKIRDVDIKDVFESNTGMNELQQKYNTSQTIAAQTVASKLLSSKKSKISTLTETEEVPGEDDTELFEIEEKEIPVAMKVLSTKSIKTPKSKKSVKEDEEKVISIKKSKKQSEKPIISKESLQEPIIMEEEKEPEAISIKNLSSLSKVGRTKLTQSIPKETEKSTEIETLPELEPVLEEEEKEKTPSIKSSKKISKPPSLKSVKIISKKTESEKE